MDIKHKGFRVETTLFYDDVEIKKEDIVEVELQETSDKIIFKTGRVHGFSTSQKMLTMDFSEKFEKDERTYRFSEIYGIEVVEHGKKNDI